MGVSEYVTPAEHDARHATAVDPRHDGSGPPSDRSAGDQDDVVADDDPIEDSPWTTALTGRWSRWSGVIGLALVALGWYLDIGGRVARSTAVWVTLAAVVVWSVGIVVLALKVARAAEDDPGGGVEFPVLVLLTGARFRWGLATTVLTITILVLLQRGALVDEWLRVAALYVGAMFAVLMLVHYLRLEYEIDERTPEHLRPYVHVYEECFGMATYASQRGLPVDPIDVQNIADAARALEDERRMWRALDKERHASQRRSRSRPASPPYQVRGSRRDDVPSGRASMHALVETHRRLAELVAPAMPMTLQLLSYPKGDSIAPWLGPIRLTRMLAGLSLVLIPTFLFLAVTVGTNIEVASLFSGDDFVANGITAVYLLVGSALGATFAALFKAYRYIEDLSYDEKNEPSYWVRWILGVVAGLILSIVIAQSGVFPPREEAETGFRLTVPLLAIAGGFSSDLVYRVLERVVVAIETLVQGATGDSIRRAQMELETRTSRKELERRSLLVAELLELRSTLPDEAVTATSRVDGLLARTVEATATALRIRVREPEDRARVAVGERQVVRLAVDPPSVVAPVLLGAVLEGGGELHEGDSPLSWSLEPVQPGPLVLAFVAPSSPSTTAILRLDVVDAAPAPTGDAGAS